MTQEARSSVVPQSGPAIRASNFELRFDGGAFVLLAYDQRESAERRPSPLVEAWDLVEVGRFVLSPIALVYLRDAVAGGAATYAAALGQSLPDPQKVLSSMKRLSGGTVSRSK